MPTYRFKNVQSEEEFDIQMPMAELDQYKKDNPNLTQVFTALNVVSGIGGLKTSNTFKDRLKEIKASHPGSTIDSGNVGDI